jgi:hypothetical protein
MRSIASRVLNISRQRLVNRLVPQIVKSRLAVVLEFFDALADALVRFESNAQPSTPISALVRVWRQSVKGWHGGSRTAIAFLAARFFQISSRGGRTGNGSETESIMGAIKR